MEEVEPQNSEENVFPGFPYPAPKGHLQIPHHWLDEIISQIDNISEMKVVMYVYRHTCGYHKPLQAVTLSTDEFMYGRMKSDQTRMDRGTGLSEKSVRNGLKQAGDHGYLVVKVDNRDKARIRKSYHLKFDISEEGQTLHPEDELEGQTLPPEGQTLHLGRESVPPREADFTDRTDKDTQKKHSKENEKETTPPPEQRLASIDRLAVHVSSQLKDWDHEEGNKEWMQKLFTLARAKKVNEFDFKHKAESVLKEIAPLDEEQVIDWNYSDKTHYYFWELCSRLSLPFKQLNYR